MNDIKIGLQIYSVREAFKENCFDALQKVKAIGYTGVELVLASTTKPPIERALEINKALKKSDMECYGILASWENLLPEMVDSAIEYSMALNCKFISIGSVPIEFIRTAEDATKVVTYMKEIQYRLKEYGITTGYHNHASDFTMTVNGESFYEYVMDNTDCDFGMILDTGNALDGGFDSIELIKKYPNRSRVLHIKGYSEEKKYLADIGRDDIDWNDLIHSAIETGKSEILNIEFGLRGDYEPFERAKSSFDVVNSIVKKELKERATVI